jgi:hypothetical protein
MADAWFPIDGEACEAPAALRFTRQGYGRLTRADGTLISRHLVAEEAYERASKEPGVCYYQPPAVKIERVVITAPAVGEIDGGGVL